MTLVRILAPRGDLRRWHTKIVQALSADGARVEVEWREGARRSTAAALLDELERLLLARRHESLLEPAAEREVRSASTQAADLVFDLTGQPSPAEDSIFPTYCGLPGDDACDAMLLGDAPPRLGLARKAGDRTIILAEGLIALERPESLRRGREAVASRLTTLIRAVVRNGAEQTCPVGPEVPRPAHPAVFLAASLTQRIASRIARLVAHEGHWRVGWRRLASPQDATQARLAWPADARWTWLADDRRRYFADPFLFEKDGVTHVFCEEFPYETGKAVISWFPLDARGAPAQPPRIVLETPCHLSYPFIFAHEGEIWMIPESSGARQLALHRADPFPHKWTLDRVLLADADVNDATICEHEGRWWMTATTREDEGSTWDCLSLYVAESPLGPWRRCGNGPALIDAGAARPAGRFFSRDAALWRPAQDCTGGYGSGLALCRVDRLNEDGLRQSIEARLGPPPGAWAYGAHTLNIGGGFETIDVCGWRSRLFG